MIALMPPVPKTVVAVALIPQLEAREADAMRAAQR